MAPRPTGGEDSPRWTIAAAVLVLAVLALRLGINALELVPVHFDEAQYWAYGQELDWGYFSKPPGVAAVIRIATDLGGDTLFALRVSSALAHAAIAAMLFLLGRRLFDAATGFWAAAAYTAAPGVSVSAMIMSTDPVMMAAWAGRHAGLGRGGRARARAGMVGLLGADGGADRPRHPCQVHDAGDAGRGAGLWPVLGAGAGLAGHRVSRRVQR